MEIIEVPAREVRIPPSAAAALDAHKPVAVTRYGRRLHVLLSERQFELVAPLLELLENGVAVSPELLRTGADIALEHDLAEDRATPAVENAQIDELLDRG
jgi:PHD/YefM family antitoxin component YafN of YafNO toxin-antitoxin module